MTRKMKHLMMAFAMMTAPVLYASAEADENFHVYLCFGQSNMEGNAQWESIDNQYVDPRFQMLATTNFTSPSRTLGQWYTAKCPIVSPAGKLGMSDYFGRTMVAALPTNVKVGVVAVAMGGSPIEMFDKDKYAQKLKDNPNEWWATLAKQYYGGNPYKRLVDMGKKAQEAGVIKGILLHQGCSNNGDPNWPSMVKKIYNDLLTDLGLEAADVPLFVGETLRQDQGGACYGHNNVVAQMPTVVPTSHIIRSNGCPGNNVDPWHFSAAGYRTMGKRYAYEALKVMGMETRKNADYTLPNNLTNFFTLTTLEDNEIVIKTGDTQTLSVWGTFADGHREDLTLEATFSSNDFTIGANRQIKGTEEKTGTVTATYTDFNGQTASATLTVIVAGGADFQLDEALNSADAIDGKTFVIYSESDGKAFYGSNNQNLGYDALSNALLKTNATICFKAERSGNNYLLRAMTPANQEYSIWGSPGYLNTQPATGSCCFILGVKNQYGQDIQNGALWEIQYTTGQGFSLRNIGTGKYLHDAAPAKYDDPAYFAFYTIKERTISGISEARQTVSHQHTCYDLYGRQVNTPSKGIYIIDGKKVLVR